jgi:hypothetical protein
MTSIADPAAIFFGRQSPGQHRMTPDQAIGLATIVLCLVLLVLLFR